MKLKREKPLIAVLCILGPCAVAYGMIRENHPIFLVGLLLVIAGYLLIRRRLKQKAKDPS